MGSLFIVACLAALPCCLAGSRQPSSHSYPWETTHGYQDDFGAVNIPLPDPVHNPFDYGQAALSGGHGHYAQEAYALPPETLGDNFNSFHDNNPAPMQTYGAPDQASSWNYGQQMYSGHGMTAEAPYMGGAGAAYYEKPPSEFSPGMHSSYMGGGQAHGRDVFPEGYSLLHRAHEGAADQVPPHMHDHHQHLSHQTEQMGQLRIGGALPPVRTSAAAAGEGPSTQRRRGKGKAPARVTIFGEPQTARAYVPAVVGEGDKLPIAPTTDRNKNDVGKEISRQLMRKEWRQRKLSCNTVKAPELAAQVAEIKINHPEQVHAIGNLAARYVRDNADPADDNAYATLYQAWTYSYTNRIKNLKDKYAARRQELTPEQLRRHLLAEFRNTELTTGPPAPGQQDETMLVDLIESVWIDFETRFLDPALEAGNEMSILLVALLSRDFHYMGQTADESMNYLAQYMLANGMYSAEEVHEFYQLRHQMGGASRARTRVRRPRASQ